MGNKVIGCRSCARFLSNGNVWIETTIWFPCGIKAFFVGPFNLFDVSVDSFTTGMFIDKVSYFRTAVYGIFAHTRHAMRMFGAAFTIEANEEFTPGLAVLLVFSSILFGSEY